jgi:hypothetical protein
MYGVRSVLLIGLTTAIAACHPSATVENTMPVANLQSYHVAALRVRATQSFLQPLAQRLAAETAQKLQTQCGFDQVVPITTPGADVLVDLNITGAARGGTNPVFKNQNLLTIETLLVLSDNSTKELLGTARIHGESSGMLVPGNSPENEATDVVSKAAVDLLAKSGCAGARVAKAPPPPDPQPPQPDPKTPTPPQPDPKLEERRPDAEALNEQGKEKLRGAEIDAALTLFQQANQMVPDARYEFNVCLAFEAQQQWDSARTACTQAKGMVGVQAALVVKIDARLQLLQNHQ